MKTTGTLAGILALSAGSAMAHKNKNYYCSPPKSNPSMTEFTCHHPGSSDVSPTSPAFTGSNYQVIFNGDETIDLSFSCVDSAGDIIGTVSQITYHNMGSGIKCSSAPVPPGSSTKVKACTNEEPYEEHLNVGKFTCTVFPKDSSNGDRQLKKIYAKIYGHWHDESSNGDRQLKMTDMLLRKPWHDESSTGDRQLKITDMLLRKPWHDESSNGDRELVLIRPIPSSDEDSDSTDGDRQLKDTAMKKPWHDATKRGSLRKRQI